MQHIIYINIEKQVNIRYGKRRNVKISLSLKVKKLIKKNYFLSYYIFNLKRDTNYQNCDNLSVSVQIYTN